MHIVHVGKYYPPERGGIETVVRGLCRGLTRRKVQVTAVVSNVLNETVDERIDGARVLRLARLGVVRSQPINPSLNRVLSELAFDVLHVHTPNPLAALAVLRALRGRPLVVHHHSDIVTQRWLGAPATLTQALLYSRAGAIVAATPLHVRYSPLLRRFEQRSRIIPLSLPHDAAVGSRELPLPASWSGRPFALFVGRLVAYKGLQVLLDAAARCPELLLAVVGSGPLERALKEQALAARLGDRVVFLGNTDQETLAALYAACRFLVLPSIEPSEAFGIVQLEAMAAGRPVISTNLRSGVPYVNQHLRTGLLVPPGDAAALVAAMQRLIESDDLCRRLGRAGKARVEREFDEESILDRWIELYSELCRAS